MDWLWYTTQTVTVLMLERRKTMPIDYKTYYNDWKEAKRLKRANNKCELCFAPNKSNIVRDKYGWYIPRFPSEHKLKTIQVVLTIHHLNNDKTDNRQANLIALCQRCHLKLHAGDRGKKERRK